MAKRWTVEEITILTESLAEGKKYAEIDLPGRSISAMTVKANTLGLSKPNNTWAHLTYDEAIDLIRIHRTGTPFDINKDLPSRNAIKTALKVKSWSECLALAKPEARSNKHIFYVLEFKDLDGTNFKKYGITGSTLKERYPSTPFNVILELYLEREEAFKLENHYRSIVMQFTPLDPKFSTGYTECFKELNNG